jgi:hypothetical protein
MAGLSQGRPVAAKLRDFLREEIKSAELLITWTSG